MKGEWCYFQSHFTPQQCKKIIEDASKLPVQQATLGVDGETVLTEYRRSKVRFIHKTDPTFTWLFDELWKMAIQCNDEWFQLHISKLDYMQLAEYDSDYLGEYKEHHDVFWINGDSPYHRKLTCVVQLSDPMTYDGGNLELTESVESPNPENIRAQGTAIFFPSLMRHKATPVIGGVRYSLACWFDGPKWR